MAEFHLSGKQEHDDVARPLAHFPASIWNYDDFLSLNITVPESYFAQLEESKENVKHMLLDSTSHFVEKVSLVNALSRLGVSHHFETEIEDQLKSIWDNEQDLLVNNSYDLNTTAILFRVLRQHGFKMSIDAFNKFKDSKGKLKEEITVNDVKGMLSLFEATHLRVRSEEFLDEVRDLTMSKLETFAMQASPHLAEHIRNALKWPLHLTLNRLEARRYISFYEKEETRNEMLLKFAKLDFNVTQSMLQKELSQFLRWWKKTNLASNLPYARDRPIESFFWITGVYFEPQYSNARMILSKSFILISLVDDTYDAFGTFDELQRFRDAIQRYDESAIDQLPNYMKILYRALLENLKELEAELTKEGRSFCIPYEKEALKDMVHAYYVEAKWFSEGYVPRFDEYKRNGMTSCGFPRLVIAALLGMRIAGVNEFEWVKSNPKSIQALQMIGRFFDDITSIEHEYVRGQVATGIECFMKEYGTSREDATLAIRKIVTDSWKDMNEECMMPNPIPKPVLMLILNFGRTIDFFYKFRDAYTYTDTAKDYVKSLLIDPIPMQHE